MKFEIKLKYKNSEIIGTNLKRKKSVNKPCQRKKITQIMKTPVEFVSAESNICHCLPFLDPPLVMSDIDPN